MQNTNRHDHIPDRASLIYAASAIRPYVHRTPVHTSMQINAMAGAEIFFKCENFQKMGAFKMRGAMYAVHQLDPEGRKRGVVTHSSGNFAQALALAAQNAGIPAYIVMPENAPKVKIAAVRDYGGEIVFSGNAPGAREEMAEAVRQKTGATFVHPSNQIEVILGNSTATQELIEEEPALDAILAPVGGGGLIAGTALAAHHFSHGTKTYGIEPVGADDAFRSLKDGVIHPSEHPQTICDGLRTNLGDVNFPIIQKLVKEIVLVDDADTIHAMRLIMERMKLVIEPSAAISLAAVLHNPQRFQGQRIGIILCGGNVDLLRLSTLLSGDWD